MQVSHMILCVLAMPSTCTVGDEIVVPNHMLGGREYYGRSTETSCSNWASLGMNSLSESSAKTFIDGSG